jgi:hypothetical protein
MLKYASKSISKTRLPVDPNRGRLPGAIRNSQEIEAVEG